VIEIDELVEDSEEEFKEQKMSPSIQVDEEKKSQESFQNQLKNLFPPVQLSSSSSKPNINIMGS
jgi:hypothetical protein